MYTHIYIYIHTHTYSLYFCVFEDVRGLNDGVYHVVSFPVPQLTQPLDPLARHFHDLDVTGGQAYSYHIRVVNYIGVGPASPPSTAMIMIMMIIK